MRSPLPSLIRFYILSTYGLKGAAARLKAGTTEDGDPTGRKAPSPKAVVKAVGIALLALLVIGDLGFLFFSSNYAQYKALKAAGLQNLLFLNASVTATFIIFLFGFAASLSTYALSGSEAFLLALPVRPRHLFTAKLATSYLSELVFSFLLLGSALAVYAWGEAPGPAFYLSGLLTILALPLIPLAVGYLLLVPLMSTARFLRNKNTIMILGGVIGLVFAMVFNFYVQGSAARMADPSNLMATYADPSGIYHRLGHTYPPALLAYLAIPQAGLAGPGLGLLNLALGLIVCALAVVALGPAYASSLATFGETQVKRLKEARGFITTKARTSRPLVALLLREIRLMNREPVYFLNGPLIVLLMPVIIAVAIVAQAKNLGSLAEALGSLGSSTSMLIAAAFGAFLGSSTSITCTAVSRDAKALSWLKSLPLGRADLGLAKFLHGFLFALFGSTIGAVGGGLVLGLPLGYLLGGFLMAVALASLVTIAGLWLDTAMPRTAWDSPTAAMKQNPNSVIVILGTMGLLGLLGYLAVSHPLATPLTLLVYGGIPAGLAVGAILAYPAYAARRFASLEP